MSVGVCGAAVCASTSMSTETTVGPPINEYCSVTTVRLDPVCSRLRLTSNSMRVTSMLGGGVGETSASESQLAFGVSTKLRNCSVPPPRFSTSTKFVVEVVPKSSAVGDATSSGCDPAPPFASSTAACASTTRPLFGNETPACVVLTNALRICSFVNAGFAAFTSAAMPATCGHAIEVPCKNE